MLKTTFMFYTKYYDSYIQSLDKETGFRIRPLQNSNGKLLIMQYYTGVSRMKVANVQVSIHIYIVLNCVKIMANRNPP